MAQGDTAKVGATSWLACQQETTYGTDACTSTAFKPLSMISCGFKVEIESEKLAELALNRGFSRRVQKNKNVAGSLEKYAHPDDDIVLWANALGGTFTFASVSAGSTYSISSGNWGTDATANSLSFTERKGDEHLFKYLGGAINSLKLSCKVGEPAKLSCEMIFQDGSYTTSEAATMTAALSFSTAEPYTFAGARYIYHASEGAATPTSSAQLIQACELEVNNNLDSGDGARALGSRLLSTRPPSGKREVKFKITQRFDTTTAFASFLAGTEGAIQMEFTGQSMPATALNRYMLIRLPRVQHNSPDFEVSGPDVLSSEIEFDVLISGNPGTTTSREIGLTLQTGRTTNI